MFPITEPLQEVGKWAADAAIAQANRAAVVRAESLGNPPESQDECLKRLIPPWSIPAVTVAYVQWAKCRCAEIQQGWSR